MSMSNLSGQLWRILAVALLFASAFSSAAMARAVFIVYDTSYSMNGRKFLPAFGASVLASTLDGRAGKDRLFTLTFGDYRAALEKKGMADGILLDADTVGSLVQKIGKPMYRQETMTDPALQQSTVTKLNERFSRVVGGTPYGPIEVMLDAIAQETTPGEEVHLIIVSDGEFDAAPATAADVLASMKTHRERIKADVRVSFLLILPPATAEYRNRTKELLDNVAAQGIRSGLLSTFNGDGNDGSYEVNSAPALWAALRDIIARISSTDQTELGNYVTYEGNSVRIDTPFSVTRIIGVSTSAKAQPPQLGTVSFPGKADSLETSMLGTDSEFRDLRFKGITSHFRFTPALPPGQHRLEFDGPTAEDVFLLFDTNVVAALDIVDAQTGQAVSRDAQGRAELELGKSYQLQSTLSDPGSTLRTDFDALSDGTVFSVEISGGPAPDARTLDRDNANDRAVATFTADTRGTFSATAQVRIPGFVSPKSEPLEFVVIDRVLDLSLAAERPAEACTGCGPTEIWSSVTIADTGADVTSLDIAVSGHAPGAVSVEVPVGADLIELIGSDGAVLAPGAQIAVNPGDVLTLTVRRRPINAAFLSTAHDGSFSIKVSPADMATGSSVEISRSLKFGVPDARIVLVSYAKGKPEDGPLALNDVELRKGGLGADLKIEGTLLAPDATNVSVSPARLGWFLQLDYSVKDYVITVAPKAGFLALAWIEASAWVSGREVDAIVRYEDGQGLQSAEARVPMAFTVAWGAFALSLVANIGILLGVIYVFWAFLAAFTVKRFPEHAVIEEIMPGNQHPRRQALRGSWMIYLAALLVPFKGVPVERRQFRGLEFEASRGGVKLVLPKQKVPGWYLTGQGMSLPALRELSPRLARVHLNWGERLEDDHDRAHSLTLIKDRRTKG